MEDQRIIDAYGGLDNTPSYLVRLRPVLKVDSERLVVAGDGLPMGADYTLAIELTSPSGVQSVVAHYVVGNLAAVGLVAQQAVLPEERPLEEKDAERLLLEEALRYIERWNGAEEELASLLHLATVRPVPTVVTVGEVVDVTYLFDTPHGFEWKGVFIDAGLRRIETVAPGGQEELEREFMRLSALEGSVLEDRIFADDFGVEAVSTAKLLAQAQQDAVPLVTLEGGNVDALLPTLAMEDYLKEDIANAVHQGLTVTVPEAEMTYRDWTGIGYLKEDPQSGEAGYMLSGMIAGGMTVDAAERWVNSYLAATLSSPYSGIPNPEPFAAASIRKVTAVDLQSGTVGELLGEPLAVMVLDKDGIPVRGAEVTFSAIAGGEFSGSQNTTALTDYKGIARARLTLGKRTGENPAFRKIDTTDAFYTRVGLNLVTSTVLSASGELSIDEPFQAYGEPGAPESIVHRVDAAGQAIPPEEISGLPNAPVGTLLALVVDKFGNPISNVDVNFSVTHAESKNPDVPLPTGYRTVEFYEEKDCSNPYPLYGECPTEPALTLPTAYYGTPVEAILGDTVNTRYTVQASAPAYPDLAPLSFTLNTTGYRAKGDYLAPGLYIRYLDIVTEDGESVDAAKAGGELAAPLIAELFLLYDDYEMVPSTCVSQYEGGPQGCFAIESTGLVKVRPIENGEVTFTPVSGDGDIVTVTNLQTGKYQATYRTGLVPAVNTIEAFGEATVTVPQSAYDPKTNKALTFGYPSATLPERTVTLKTGQEALFDARTREPVVASNWQKATYTVYGVGVELTVDPQIVVLTTDGYTSEDTRLKYTVSPSEYAAAQTEVDLYRKDPATGALTFVGPLRGDAVQGSGEAVMGAWNRLDPAREYEAQPVLSRGTAVEVKGEKVPLRTLLCDLDIDSDNNAGFAGDGSPLGPNGDKWEDQVEDVAGQPGKVIRPNLADSDGDGIPDFAENDPGAAFYPAVLHLGGSLFDPNTATVTFSYPGSDPAQVTQSTDEAGKTTYIPDPGSLRLWKKDGRVPRTTDDYIQPSKPYTLGELSWTSGADGLSLYVESVGESLAIGSDKIALSIDPDGEGPTPYIQADAIRMTGRNFAIIPDYNHDRVIDEDDRKRALAGDTYYFWLNDDDDIDELEGSDIPGAGNKDGENDVIDGMRDLTDFFPVFLDIKDLISMFPPESYVYKLSSQDNALNFTYSHLDYGSSGKYLDDVDIAKMFIDRKVEGVVSGGAVLNKEALQYINQNETKGVFLFEGKAKTSAPLALEVRDLANNLVYHQELSLSLDGIEQMFRHKNLTRVLAAMQEFPEYRVQGHTIPSEGREDRLESDDFSNKPHFSGFDAENDDLDIVFVHGYNVNAQDARGAQAEVFKRLYWSGSRARFWGITWYGYESQSDSIIPCLGTRALNYHVNVRHAFNTGKLLKEFIDGPGPKNATFIAHSLGNMVESSAIRSGLSYARYLMVNAAVAEEAFMPGSSYEGDNWATNTRPLMYHPEWRYPHELLDEEGYQPFLWASEWHNLFSDDRARLTWRGFFEKVNTDERVHTFYAPTDEAFIPFNWNPFVSHPDGETAQSSVNIDDIPGVEDVIQNWSCSDPEKLGTHAFAFQELLKGRMWRIVNADSSFGGWGFNRDQSDGHYVCAASDLEGQSEVCEFISPVDANSIDQTLLRTRPLFKKNPDKDQIYTDGPVSISGPEQVELLANEMPALTFATGHDGSVDAFSDRRNIDIRQKYLLDHPGTPWIQDRKAYEWRHNDLYFVAYPYLYRMYDDWAKLIKGENLQ